MQNFADRLLDAVAAKGNSVVVGLDPRLEMMPDFLKRGNIQDQAAAIITSFHKLILDVVAPLVPAVKLQSAFYEQYGLAGMAALQNTIDLARERNLVVIVDVKRNDISSTATAYANAFLGRAAYGTDLIPAFDADCITVSPYLGRDSLEPFVEVCSRYGRGIFILVKTSNPGSRDFQDEKLLRTGAPLYELVAEMVADLGQPLVGHRGYSSVGAVVGATFSAEASRLRELMPRNILLIPGYGAQGGTAQDVACCFDAQGLGAVVSSSRGITYPHRDPSITEDEFSRLVLNRTQDMIRDLSTVLPTAVGR
jgi:orotidine-5'-phosphate decarboxylase